MSVEKVLSDFVASKEPGALIMQGPWGIGKTFFWEKRVIANLLRKPWKKKYSYVSLFGINSLPDLRVAIAVATDEFDRDAVSKRRLESRLWGRFWKSLQWLGDIFRIVPRSGNAIAAIYERISFYFVKDRIICFDDIERHGKGLEIKDFLGIVSFLVEQRRCRVVAILNADSLDDDDQKIWKINKEKVFHGEVTYRPALRETIELGLLGGESEAWYKTVLLSLEELNVSNIRLVQRTARFVRLACQSFSKKDLTADVVNQIGRAIPLLVWSIHGASSGAPPLDFLLGRGAFDPYLLGSRNSSDVTADERRWHEILTKYGYFLNGKFDESLIGMVSFGFPDAEDFAMGIDDLMAHLDLDQKRRVWQGAWNMYHQSVSDNGDEIAAAFDAAWPLVVDREHAVNLQGAARILRIVGRPDLATKFIGQWVDARKGTRIGELAPRELNMFDRITDEEIISSCSQALGEHREIVMDIAEAFDVASKSSNLSEVVVATFASADVDDIVAVLDNSGGENFSNAVKRLSGLSGYPDMSMEKTAGTKFMAACARVSARSALNADRMKNWINMQT